MDPTFLIYDLDCIKIQWKDSGCDLLDFVSYTSKGEYEREGQLSIEIESVLAVIIFT